MALSEEEMMKAFAHSETTFYKDNTDLRVLAVKAAMNLKNSNSNDLLTAADEIYQWMINEKPSKLSLKGFLNPLD